MSNKSNDNINLNYSALDVDLVNKVTETLAQYYLSENSRVKRRFLAYEAWAQAAEVFSDFVLCRQIEQSVSFDGSVTVEVGTRPYYEGDPFGDSRRLFGDDEDFPDPEGVERYVYVKKGGEFPLRVVLSSRSARIESSIPISGKPISEVLTEDIMQSLNQINSVLHDYPSTSWANPRALEEGETSLTLFSENFKPHDYLQKNYPEEVIMISQILLNAFIPSANHEPAKPLKM